MTFIHPTAIVDKTVELGDNCYIGPYCTVVGFTKIGNNVRLESYVSIGTPPEHRDYLHSHGAGVVIYDNVTIREFSTVNSGTTKPTVLCDRVLMLRGAHIGHDAYIGNDVTISCNVMVGGNTMIGTHSVIGLSAVIHQNQIIAPYCMLGMSTVVTRDFKTRPGFTYAGNPIAEIGENTIGLKKNKISKEFIEHLRKDY